MSDAPDTTDQTDHQHRGQGFDGVESAAASAPTEVQTKVRELLDQRAAIADELATVGALVESRRAELADTEKEYATLYRAAVDAGWTEKELTTKIGFPNPSAAPRRRRAPRKNQTNDDSQ